MRIIVEQREGETDVCFRDRVLERIREHGEKQLAHLKQEFFDGSSRKQVTLEFKDADNS